MTEQELKRIAAKISKCLALTSSDNPTEAANAKRQAEALMKKYNLTTGDVVASQVHETHSKTGGKHRPPVYLAGLAAIIADAFGCETIFTNGCGWQASFVRFMGMGVKPELAAYTFEVLARQIKKDRNIYLATLKRFKRSNKTRMADIFCQAWVARIAEQVREFAGTEQEKQAIAAYKQQKFGDRLKSDNRGATQPLNDRDLDASAAGHLTASNVSIHKPVHTKRNQLLE